MKGGLKYGIVMLCLLSAISGPTIFAQGDGNPKQAESRRKAVKSAISASDLDKALKEELKSRRYAWKMPRQPREKAPEGPVSLFLSAVMDTLSDWAKAFGRLIGKVLRWLGDKMPRFGPAKPGEPRELSSISAVMRLVLYLLLAVALCIGAVSLFRIIKRLREQQAEIIVEKVEVEPDIENEDTTADELPEEGWLKMARELTMKDELRLALRAVFLGSIASLAERHFIHIARFKSNLDYKNELAIHAHENPQALELFSHSSSIYESTWYGAREATMEMLNSMFENQRRLG